MLQVSFSSGINRTFHQQHIKLIDKYIHHREQPGLKCSVEAILPCSGVQMRIHSALAGYYFLHIEMRL